MNKTMKVLVLRLPLDAPIGCISEYPLVNGQLVLDSIRGEQAIYEVIKYPHDGLPDEQKGFIANSEIVTGWGLVEVEAPYNTDRGMLYLSLGKWADDVMIEDL